VVSQLSLEQGILETVLRYGANPAYAAVDLGLEARAVKKSSLFHLAVNFGLTSNVR
jgi:hypothetical protein